MYLRTRLLCTGAGYKIPAALAACVEYPAHESEDEPPWLAEMLWATPIYERRRVRRAGQILIKPDPPSYDRPADLDQIFEYMEALEIINNWRSSHNFPLNTFQIGLRRRAKAIEAGSIIAQRIERLSSIKAKLQRFPTMTLPQMQDIGGCRAVMSSISHVNRLVKAFESSEIKHKLAVRDDYISKPKDSGYREVHLIYKYYSDRKPTYNELKIEVQLRSQTQHIWATAVETVGTFLSQALKSSQGEADWLRFFTLMGSAFAEREGTALVPGTPNSHVELIREIREYAKRLDLARRLDAYGSALNVIENPQAEGSHYFLVHLDPSDHEVKIWGYPSKDSELATKDYLEIEKRIAGKAGADAVLVSVDSLASLRRAYPNYFLDTQVFIAQVREITRTLKPRKSSTKPSKQAEQLSLI